MLMAVKTSYTEEEVQTYMEDVLGDTADKLGWTNDGGDFDEPTNEVLYVLSEDDFTFVNTRDEAYKVRLVARVEVWRAAAYYTAHEASFSAGNPGTGSTNRADVHRHCRKMYEMAYTEMLDKFPALGAQVSRQPKKYEVNYEGDYYANAG